LATLHTKGAPKTIDRIINVFPPYHVVSWAVGLISLFDEPVKQYILDISSAIDYCKHPYSIFDSLINNSPGWAD
jgi:Tfp pilus assembly pilus retraction ATPase PilT